MPGHARSSPHGLLWFCLLAVGMFALRLVFGVATVPPAAVGALNLVSAVVFVAVPLYALFLGCSHGWAWPSSAAVLVVGAAVQVGAGWAVSQLHLIGASQVVAQAIGQTGLLVWCLGLGVLVSLLIKDKNLMVPIALFLAGFDVFLVLTPYAPTAAILEQRPEVFQSVASSVPKARVATIDKPSGAKVETLAYVGPADFLFSAVFFALVFKFGMRAKATLKWLAVVLVAYLLAVMAPVGLGMLPALVPIGATVLLVNRGEFSLTRDEKQATWAVAAVAVVLAGFGITQRLNYRAKPILPSGTGTAPDFPEPGAPAGKPAPGP